MAPIDQFWNLGKVLTNQTRFNSFGDVSGGGQGWGGNGGNWNGDCWASRHSHCPGETEDLMGSIWNATPIGSDYMFTNVNGDWYHTGTIITDGNTNTGTRGGFHCPPPLGDVFFKNGVKGLGPDETQFGPNCLGVIFSYVLNGLCGKSLNYGEIQLKYCQIYNVPYCSFGGYEFDVGGFSKFFNLYFNRGDEESPIDAINSGHPCLGFVGRNQENGHQIAIIGYNLERGNYYYIDPEMEGIQDDLEISAFQNNYIYSITGCK